MNEKVPTHIAYSDESCYHGGNYSSICLVSMPKDERENLESEIRKIINESGLKEFKWVKTGSARERYCAKKLIDLVYKCAKSKRIRIDTIIWDSKKRKEQIPEDNNTILGKMYYHLYKNVFNMRWSNDCIWELFPDEQGVIDWVEMKKILENVSSRIIIKKEEGKPNFEIVNDFLISHITEVNSKDSPICQIADLFSGLAAFYHLECPLLNLNTEQMMLEKGRITLTNKQKERIEIIGYLKSKFAGGSIEISFDSFKGMYTKNPNGQINFWQFDVSMSRHQNQKLQKWF